MSQYRIQLLETYLDLAWAHATGVVTTLPTERIDLLVGALFRADLDRLLLLDDELLDVAFSLSLVALFETVLRSERRLVDDLSCESES